MAIQADTIPKVLNDSLFDSANIKKFKKKYTTSNPFPLVCLESFLNKDFIPKLEASLDENLTLAKKDNDLFKFYQSYGLEELPPNTAIQQLIKSLYSQQFLEFLFKTTGKKVINTPDLFASCYTDTSYLLCHDDQVENRRISFILYLVPEDWNAADGGALNLYDSYTVDDKQNSNSSNDTNSICMNIFPKHAPFKQLIPKRNSVVIFEVSDKSFHAVDEVLSKDKNRITIAGWWHSKYVQNNIKTIPISDPVIAWNDAMKTKNNHGLLKKWLNPTYLKEESMKTLQGKFLEESHLILISFLNEDLYYKLLNQMFLVKYEEKNGVFWKRKGPIHRRLYYELNGDGNTDDTALIVEFKELIGSMEWKRFMEKITNVEILKNNVEIRRFRHKNYTIAHDLDRFKDIAGVDVALQFIENEENGWNPKFGGSTYYTIGKETEDDEDENKDNNEKKEDQVKGGDMEAEEEDEEDEDENIIMAVHPIPNTLSITYRSECGVMSFVKYLNHHAPCSLIDFKQIWTVNDKSESDTDGDKDNVNEKKRKCDDEVQNEPPLKKQKN